MLLAVASTPLTKIRESIVGGDPWKHKFGTEMLKFIGDGIPKIDNTIVVARFSPGLYSNDWRRLL